MSEEVSKHEFKAEVCKLLNILTNSLYTNREIFLRELISNASDALDKLRFRINRGDKPIADDLPLEIRITLDKDKKTLIIQDTGLGMTKEELSENLGTVAKSGTEAFLNEIAASHKEGEEKTDASNIIGRFGIGFYSVFMVADSVTVSSRAAFSDPETPAYAWTSDGLGTYTIEKVDDGPARGTKIIVHMKEDATEFLEKYRIDSIIKQHSAFVPFPVFVDNERANTQPALWREPKSSVTAEQYNSFYKAMTYDSKDPFDVQHIAVDVPVQFSALLFIPDETQDFFTTDNEMWGLDLYSRRVLIQKRNKDLLPEYLGFMKGVVDVEDLPLNISRETLQENVMLRKIQQVLVKQTLTKLEKLASDDKEKYEHFWRKHSRIFKLCFRDYTNQERTCALMRFSSSAMPDAEAGKEALTSFDEYMSRAQEGQKNIWYVAAPNREAARVNPHMEIFRKKGIEVLYLLDPVDEFVIENIRKYKDWEFKAAEAASTDDLKTFPDKEDANKPEVSPLSNEDADFFNRLLEHIKTVLGEKVKKVVISKRLDDSPAVLVTPEGGMTSSMEKMMKVMQHDESMPVRDLEINQDHPLTRSMIRIFKANPTDPILQQMIENLFDACLLMDGYVGDPQQVATRTRMLLENSAAWYTEVKKL
ncbi:MAG: molecular chaperone HtpG [Desulfovibrionaceae bacterium]|nr:molecular chaperone HtpG [Desulfovibrionaceae bacterium]